MGYMLHWANVNQNYICSTFNTDPPPPPKPTKFCNKSVQEFRNYKIWTYRHDLPYDL
jgi:hypothetical protein